MSSTRYNVFNLNTSFLKNITIAQNTLFLENRDSYNNTTGGVVMYGGLGVSKNLNIGGNINTDGNLYVNGDQTINENLKLKGNLNIDKEIYTKNDITLNNKLHFGTFSSIVKSDQNSTFTIKSNNNIHISSNNNIHLSSNNNIYILPDTKIGIGTTDPLNFLDINGNVGIKGEYISFGTNTLDNSYGIRDNSGTMQLKNNNDQWRNISASLWDSNNNDIYYNKGKIGIHIQNPSVDLDIKGNVAITNNLSCSGNIIVDNILINSATTFEHNLNLNNKLNIKNTDDSYNNRTGSLIIAGGLSINKNIISSSNITVADHIYIGKNLHANNSIIHNNINTNIIKTQDTITNNITISNILNTKSATITDDITINQNLNINNNINLEGNINVKLNLNVEDTLCISNIKTNTNNHHIFDKNNNEVITIKETGYIGIGTANPQNTLHISGTNSISTPTSIGIHAGLLNTNNSQITLAKKNINNSNIIDFYDVISTNYDRIESTNNTLKFYTNSTPQVIINSLGCVGIGTQDPKCALSICSEIGDDRIIEKGIHFTSPILNYQRVEFVSAGFSGNLFYHGALEFKNINNELDNDFEERIITYKNNGVRTIELDSEAVVIIGTTHTFTGSHFAILSSDINTYSNDFTEHDENAPNNLIFKRGLIVSARDSTHISINNSIFNVELANTDNDKQVIGVFSNNYYPPEHERLHTNSNASINSIGEGAIWVTNINDNILSGDYITSSSIPGYGKKQDDDLLHNYTVAKCITNVNWDNIVDTITYNNNTYKKAFVACTYHCG